MPLLRKAMENPDVTVATVCGGSLALAMAGLLEGRNAVTHHLGMDLLEATGVNAVNARVVDDGDLVTSGSGHLGPRPRAAPARPHLRSAGRTRGRGAVRLRAARNGVDAMRSSETGT